MVKNTFVALMIAYGTGLLGGLLTLLIGNIVLGNHLHSDNEIISTSAICNIVGIVADFFGPLVLCVILLLPLSIIDKKKIEESPFAVLVKRYLPLITLPIGLLFSLVLLYDHQPDNDKYLILINLLNIYGICISGLWFFLRKLKSSQ
jgi:hypothetical protein